MKITLKIKPNSNKNEIIKVEDGFLVIKIKEPAIDGKANEGLVKFLSKLLKLPKSKIEILKGHTSPIKILEIEITEESFWREVDNYIGQEKNTNTN